MLKNQPKKGRKESFVAGMFPSFLISKLLKNNDSTNTYSMEVYFQVHIASMLFAEYVNNIPNFFCPPFFSIENENSTKEAVN